MRDREEILKAVAAKVAEVKQPPSRPGKRRLVSRFASEEEYFDHLLESIGDNPCVDIDLGDPGVMERFCLYWSRKMFGHGKG